MKISFSIFTCHLFLLFLILFTLPAASEGQQKKDTCNPDWVFEDWETIASSQCFHQPVENTMPKDQKYLILISIWEYCGTTALAVFNKCFDIINFLISFLVAIFQYVYVFIQSVLAKPIVVNGLSYFNHLKSLVWPTINGLAVVIFSWIIMYFDSKIPGVYPPSPISPRKHRVRSGHTFHLGYTVGLLNGMMAFSMTLWQQLIE